MDQLPLLGHKLHLLRLGIVSKDPLLAVFFVKGKGVIGKHLGVRDRIALGSKALRECQSILHARILVPLNVSTLTLVGVV